MIIQLKWKSSKQQSTNHRRQWRNKEVISWGQEGETVKYYEYKKYFFKPELSADWDQDIITVNPIVAVSKFVKFHNSWLPFCVPFSYLETGQS